MTPAHPYSGRLVADLPVISGSFTTELDDETWSPVTWSGTYRATFVFYELPARTAMDYVRRSNRWPKPGPMVELDIPQVAFCG